MAKPAGRLVPVQRDPVAEIMERLAGKDFLSLKDRYPGSTWHKYLNLPKFVPASVKYCEVLGLIDAAPQRILDIGCGTGLFLYCAHHFGHSGVGIDIETDLMAEMAAMLGVEREIERVAAFTPLHPRGKFNLIVCMGTQFDGANPSPIRRQWGLPDWNFFLADLLEQLTPDGRVFLRINRGREAKRAGRMYYNEHLAKALQHGHRGGIAYLFDREGLAVAVRNTAHRQ
jgi:SAM-dependent methyltransferase